MSFIFYLLLYRVLERFSGVNYVDFLQQNQWIKRGLAVTPIRFGVLWHLTRYYCQISIYSNDASVAFTVSGIDMGQYMNTQVLNTAYHLGFEVCSTYSMQPAHDIFFTQHLHTCSSCLGYAGDCRYPWLSYGDDQHLRHRHFDST